MTIDLSPFTGPSSRSAKGPSEWVAREKMDTHQWCIPALAEENAIAFYDSRYMSSADAPPESECPSPKAVRERAFDEHFDSLLDLRISSNRLLELTEDWDEEGSLPYRKETLERAFDFLFGFINYAYDSTNKLVDIPRVLPGPEGSIDILWKNDRSKLLLNVPPRTELLGYYGYNRKGEEVRGRIHPDAQGFAQTLAMWLSQN